MGLDGGTLATRSDLLRRSSWRLTHSDGGASRSTRGGQLGASDALATSGLETRNRRQEAVDAWATCALSGTFLPAAPLPGAIVSCALGQLYLRDSVVEFLTKTGQFQPGMCNPAALEETFGHIERLRDVFSVTLQPNLARNQAGAALAAADSSHGSASKECVGPWCCPVDQVISTNGQHAFVALRPCGHVIRERLALELSKMGGPKPAAAAGASTIGDGVSRIQGGMWACPACNAAVEVTVKLLPPAADCSRLRESLKAEREARRERKRKRKDRATDDFSSATLG